MDHGPDSYRVSAQQKALVVRHFMFKTTIFFLLILVCFVGLGQDSIKVAREYWNDIPITKADSAFNSIPDVLFIDFDEGFDDSIVVTINDERIFSGYIKTNESIGLAHSLIISNKNPKEVKILKVTFVNANKCIVERLNLNHKSLHIRGLNPWVLIYTNRFPMRM
jgi:hypothetical protein